MILDILFIATGWIHVLLAPYTKVEESFNLHATHDVLMYGVGHPSTLEYVSKLIWRIKISNPHIESSMIISLSPGQFLEHSRVV